MDLKKQSVERLKEWGVYRSRGLSPLEKKIQTRPASLGVGGYALFRWLHHGFSSKTSRSLPSVVALLRLAQNPGRLFRK